MLEVPVFETEAEELLIIHMLFYQKDEKMLMALSHIDGSETTDVVVESNPNL